MTVSYVTMCLGFVLIGQYVSQEHGVEHEFGRRPLYDVVHAHLPDVSPYYWVNDVMVLFPLVRFWHIGQDLQQFLFSALLALTARAFTLMVTSQPTCTPQCFHDAGSFPLHTCFDFLYSGHTVSITVASIGIIKDTTPWPSEKVFWFAYAPFCALWISMSRQHYTADTMLALLVGSLLCF